MASAIKEQIQHASARNAELLQVLHDTESAPSQLYQQINYIQDLNNQITKSEKNVHDLRRKTHSELEDHKKYSESTFRRFAHKASGQKEKFAEKAAKEEREYFSAIQAQKTAEDDLAYAKQLLAEATIQKDKYETQARRHEAHQQELDALYNSIFAGPTPGFPIEDERENAVASASQHCTQVSQALEKERQIVFHLKELGNRLHDASNHLDHAHSLSQWDMFGSGGAITSMRKRNALERAESSISQVRMHQEQVLKLKPDIGDLGTMNIATGSILTDVVFDNIFTDMDMHSKIKDSEAQIQRASRILATQVKEAEEREKYIYTDVQYAGEALQTARKELQKAREQAFARVNGEEYVPYESVEAPVHDDAPPPAYTA